MGARAGLCVWGVWGGGGVCVCVYIFDKFGPDQNLKLNKSFEGIRVECVCVCVCVDLLVGEVVS